jgi:predicted HTH domain antitoxin
MSSPSASAQSKTRVLSVDLPEIVVQLLGPSPQEAARHLAELAMVELFRQGEVSSGWAAEQLKITKDDFLRLLARQQVPYIDMTEEEFLQQLQAAAPVKEPPTR